MADLPDPVGPDTTLSLPVGKSTERSISWNGVSVTRVESAEPEAVSWVLVAGELELPLVMVFLSFLSFLPFWSFESLEAASSDCLPVFHCSVACLNPMLLESDAASGRRFKEETQSGTVYQLDSTGGDSLPSSSFKKSSIRLTDTCACKIKTA